MGSLPDAKVLLDLLHQPVHFLDTASQARQLFLAAGAGGQVVQRLFRAPDQAQGGFVLTGLEFHAGAGSCKRRTHPGTVRPLTYIALRCIVPLRKGDVLPVLIDKDLVAASATPLVLAILNEGESYGYAIIKRVGELSGGELEWTDGMLYPLLHRLERNGYVEAIWGKSETGRQRKYYRLTKAGIEQLDRQRRQWHVVDRAMRGIFRVAVEPSRAF